MGGSASPTSLSHPETPGGDTTSQTSFFKMPTFNGQHHVNVKRTGVSDTDGGVAMGSAVRTCSSMHTLLLSDCLLTGRLPDPEYREKDRRGGTAPLSLVGITALANAIGSNRSLTEADLSCNNITAWNQLYGTDSCSDTASVGALARALRTNTRLRMLQLGGNNLGICTQMQLQEEFRGRVVFRDKSKDKAKAEVKKAKGLSALVGKLRR